MGLEHDRFCDYQIRVVSLVTRRHSKSHIGCDVILFQGDMFELFAVQGGPEAS